MNSPPAKKKKKYVMGTYQTIVSTVQGICQSQIQTAPFTPIKGRQMNTTHFKHA